MLQTPNSKYLFQERDNNAKFHPGKIAAFGGGIEDGEDVYQCAKRELQEELNLDIESSNLETIGLFESRHEPGIYIHMFLVRGVDSSALTLHEGKGIVELSLGAALQHDKVTDFTKEVLRSI